MDFRNFTRKYSSIIANKLKVSILPFFFTSRNRLLLIECGISNEEDLLPWFRRSPRDAPPQRWRRRVNAVDRTRWENTGVKTPPPPNAVKKFALTMFIIIGAVLHLFPPRNRSQPLCGHTPLRQPPWDNFCCCVMLNLFLLFEQLLPKSYCFYSFRLFSNYWYALFLIGS
jgi:hypothetical protein